MDSQLKRKLLFTVGRMIEEISDETLVIAMEELSELSQATSKLKRGKADYDNIAEEIADVLVCIEVIKKIGGISDSSIEKWVDFKLDRTLSKISKGEFH